MTGPVRVRGGGGDGGVGERAGRWEPQPEVGCFSLGVLASEDGASKLEHDTNRTRRFFSTNQTHTGVCKLYL